MADRSKAATSDLAADLDPVLLEVVACPACHGALAPRGTTLVCAACALAYPIRDGIPVLLADDAESIGGAASAKDVTPADDAAPADGEPA